MFYSTRLYFLAVFVLVSLLFQSPAPFLKAADLEMENKQIAQSSTLIEELYQLEEGESFKDITAQVLANPKTTEEAKKSMLAYQRRIYLFEYPSDGLMVKGFISLTPQSDKSPLLVLFRGGNEKFGLISPATPLAAYQNFTVISSILRGGLSEGQDEYGGEDVRDMKHLIEFVPTLEKWLNVQISMKPLYLVGESRGGMEMFLMLARYPELQNRIDKVVAVSGLLDLRNQIQNRSDMKQMFIEKFGLREGVNEEEWIQKRDPLLTVPHLKKCLPILIVQGTEDQRVKLLEGYEMVKRLHDSGHAVDYWEIEGGDHVLRNKPQSVELIAHWLESSPPSPIC